MEMSGRRLRARGSPGVLAFGEILHGWGPGRYTLTPDVGEEEEEDWMRRLVTVARWVNGGHAVGEIE